MCGAETGGFLDPFSDEETAPMGYPAKVDMVRCPAPEPRLVPGPVLRDQPGGAHWV